MGQPVERNAVEAAAPIECLHRAPDDDFFCLRFAVWYPSRDCAIRTRFRTSSACAGCDQGRFNLKRHASSLAAIRWPRTAAAR